MRRLIVASALAALLTGCAKDLYQDQVGQLRQGMSTVEVSGVLGAPHELTRRGTQEAWQYCWKGIAQDGFLVAWLDGNLLEDWELRGSSELGDCPTLMETLVWPEDRAPEKAPAS